MRRVVAGWSSAAAISLAVHCAVFGCAAWALGAKKEYMPAELFRFREAPMVARRAEPVSQSPKTERAPAPPPRQTPLPPKAEPPPVAPEPAEPAAAKVELPAPVPQPDIAPAPEAAAHNAPLAPPMESLPPAAGYRETEQLSNLPYFRTNIKPLYPKTALRSGRKARVVAEVFINENGVVDDVRIAESGGEEFDAAVIAALRQSLFEPGFIAGRAVAVKVRIPFNFRVG